MEEEPKRGAEAESVQDLLKKLWAENPLPARTGERADKAFFDDLSGEQGRVSLKRQR